MARTASKQRNFASEHSVGGVPTAILDDLCARFLLNVPNETRADPVRVCFQVELAHWYYMDFYVNTSVPVARGSTLVCRACGVREFIQ